jgi:Zn-finger nucleic acid-binding protein
MDCPVCKNAMITMELSEVEIDYCTGCEGIWLDAGELEMLLGDGEKSREFIKSFNKTEGSREEKRKCPICDKKMDKIIVGHEKRIRPLDAAPLDCARDRQGRQAHRGPTIMIDRCARGDGLWFDRGELKDVIERAKLDEGEKIKRLLADMFGQRKSAG